MPDFLNSVKFFPGVCLATSKGVKKEAGIPQKNVSLLFYVPTEKGGYRKFLAFRA